MRIAQVAPLIESVPPQGYGGTERVVSYLTEELVRQGHEVTLFASGDSVASARLVAPCRASLRRDPQCRDPLAPYMLMLERVFHHASRFDLIHFRPKPGQYLAFLGRIAPEKRVDRAIAIAQQIGMDLKIDAKVDPTDREHFETVIAPLFREPLVEYVGEKGL